jgi:hypothetical protein
MSVDDSNWFYAKTADGFTVVAVPFSTILVPSTEKVVFS